MSVVINNLKLYDMKKLDLTHCNGKQFNEVVDYIILNNIDILQFPTNNNIFKINDNNAEIINNKFKKYRIKVSEL